MFGPEKLSVLYFVYEAIAVAVVAAGVAGVVALGAFADAPLWLAALFGVPAVLVVAFLTWWIPAFARSSRYRLTAEEIEYERGVFFEQQTTIPYDRITNVYTSQGPIERRFGAGTVGIHTAGHGGQAGAELTITGVTDADELKEQVLDRVRQRRPVATEGADGARAVDAGTPGTESGDELLAEVRRIRVLLEDG